VLVFKKVREARFTSQSYFVCFFLVCSMIIGLSSRFLSNETELHALLDVGLNYFCCCMCANSGETCHSRPSELVSPKQEYQDARPGSARASRPGDQLWFLSDARLAQAKTARLGEPSRKPVMPLLESSIKRGASLFLGERRSRPGENSQMWPLYQYFASRLGENA